MNKPTTMNITNENVDMYVLESAKCKSFDEFGAIEIEKYKYILIEWDSTAFVGQMELDYEDVVQWITKNMNIGGNTVDDFILHICTADKMDLINGFLSEKLCK